MFFAKKKAEENGEFVLQKRKILYNEWYKGYESVCALYEYKSNVNCCLQSQTNDFQSQC